MWNANRTRIETCWAIKFFESINRIKFIVHRFAFFSLVWNNLKKCKIMQVTDKEPQCLLSVCSMSPWREILNSARIPVYLSPQIGMKEKISTWFIRFISKFLNFCSAPQGMEFLKCLKFQFLIGEWKWCKTFFLFSLSFFLVTKFLEIGVFVNVE